MDSYVALDIENPNARGNSICSIGIVVVDKGRVVQRVYSLINPEDRFDRRNKEITGISENMVLSSPTLPEFWGGVKSLIEGSLIVGHNVRYDLNVLSKSLDRYGLTLGSPSYICTMSMSKDLLTAGSYRLSHLCDSLGYAYDAHNAAADAEAAAYLFEYLKRTFPDYALLQSKYFYQKTVSESLDEKLVSNLNELNGIIRGITADQVVDDREIACLQEWINKNTKYALYSVFDRILQALNSVLDDGRVTDYEIRILETLTNVVERSKVYSETTLGIQVLQGILRGISSDGRLHDKELVMLGEWLVEHDYLVGVYPFDKIAKALSRICEDGLVTDAEKAEMLRECEEVLNPVQACEGLDLQGKTFCLTGDFACGSKAEIESKLINKGAVKKSAVSGRLDYLFVGSLGSEAWKYGYAGGKIAKAQELQEKGKPIQIIGEEDLVPSLER